MHPAHSEPLSKAFGVITGYPTLLETIGWMDRPRNFELTAAAFWNAKMQLLIAHNAAIGFVVAEAQAHNLEPTSLIEFGRICRARIDEDASEFGLNSAREFDTWPDCLGAARRVLTPTEQQCIIEGERILHRIAIMRDVEEVPDHKLSVKEFATLSGKSQPWVSKNKGRIGPLTLESARRIKSESDGRKNKVDSPETIEIRKQKVRFERP